jgi:transcriptional regulator with XRE-family HTH domain
MNDKEVDARAHPVDIHVGKRIRRRRLQVGMSLAELGKAAAGVSFQQVQKYEGAANRVSASTLYLIAQALGCTREYFFEGLDEAPQVMDEQDIMARFAAEDGAVDIARVFPAVPIEARPVLIKLAELVAAVGAPQV